MVADRVATPDPTEPRRFRRAGRRSIDRVRSTGRRRRRQSAASGAVDRWRPGRGDGVAAQHPGVAPIPAPGPPAAETGLPVAVDNDAKALALGEGWLGAARGVDNYLAMVVSTGIGGGIVLDGQLLDGAHGNAGHIGHVVVEPDGRPCPCGGRGCLEAEASGLVDRGDHRASGRARLPTPCAVAPEPWSAGRWPRWPTCWTCELAVVAGSVALGFGAIVLRCRPRGDRAAVPARFLPGDPDPSRPAWAPTVRWSARPRSVAGRRRRLPAGGRRRMTEAPAARPSSRRRRPTWWRWLAAVLRRPDLWWTALGAVASAGPTRLVAVVAPPARCPTAGCGSSGWSPPTGGPMPIRSPADVISYLEWCRSTAGHRRTRRPPGSPAPEWTDVRLISGLMDRRSKLAAKTVASRRSPSDGSEPVRSPMSPSRRALVLNATFEPLGIVSSRRAVLLVLDTKAELVHTTERVFRAERLTVPEPSVVRLVRYVQVPRHYRVAVNRRTVFARDGSRCQYCGSAAENLDHVIPRSKGGPHTWENVVAACRRCNTRKEDRLPHEAGMVLRSTPGGPAPPGAAAGPVRGRERGLEHYLAVGTGRRDS